MMRIGILGGGQLGQMLILAGTPLGLQFLCMDPAENAPVDSISERIIHDYHNIDALRAMREQTDIITYEFENIPVLAVRYLAEKVPVYPGPDALEVAQDRLSEKNFFRDLNIPVPEYLEINSLTDLQRGVKIIGLPAVLKLRRMGYDGKGQYIIRQRSETEAAWNELGEAPLILEEYIQFEYEMSQIAVRSAEGEIVFYPLAQNTHRNGILRLSLAPAPNASAELQKLAQTYISDILQKLRYVGALAVEFFYRNGAIIANEMAPRVHNSGHWSIEGAETSQFENHIRAVAGLPLGAAKPIGHSAMLNIIGVAPQTSDILSIPGAHAHIYGKSPRPWRKLGHITIRCSDPEELAARIELAQKLLQIGS